MANNKSIADVSLDGLLKGDPQYRVLFKYQRITEYALDALRGRYLFFSSYPQLNDPFDPFLRLIASQADELMRAISEKGPKIFCLSEERYNPLMWGHYGASGSGMCVGYAVHVGNPRIFNPVRYVESFDGQWSVLDLLSMKSVHWKWEAEWRACIPGDEQKITEIAHPVSICLGPRCSTDDMKRVRNVIPDTVKDFEIVFPVIENAVPCYATYDVDKIVQRYGGVPTLDDLWDGAQ